MRLTKMTKMDKLVRSKNIYERRKGWMGYRVSLDYMVEGSLDRRRSLELTRSGEGYWYRQASTIQHQCLSRFQIESCATFARSLCEHRSACCESFISWWHCHLCKQILLDAVNWEYMNCISCIKQDII